MHHILRCLRIFWWATGTAVSLLWGLCRRGFFFSHLLIINRVTPPSAGITITAEKHSFLLIAIIVGLVYEGVSKTTVNLKTPTRKSGEKDNTLKT